MALVIDPSAQDGIGSAGGGAPPPVPILDGLPDTSESDIEKPSKDRRYRCKLCPIGTDPIAGAARYQPLANKRNMGRHLIDIHKARPGSSTKETWRRVSQRHAQRRAGKARVSARAGHARGRR